MFICFLFLSALRGILNNPTKTVRDTLINQCAQILACYRKNCASPSSAGQVLKTSACPLVCQRVIAEKTQCERHLYVSFCRPSADPSRVHEAVTSLSELCAEE